MGDFCVVYMDVYLWVDICMGMQVPIELIRHQRPLERGYQQLVMSYSAWMLGLELESSTRAVNAFNS